MKKKIFCTTGITALISFLACANMYAQGGGFLLGRTGVEVSERPHINNRGDFATETRIGGKLDNIVLGVSYLITDAKSFYAGSGLGADLGYDARFKRGWGINTNLHYAATANKGIGYQNQFNDLGLTLAVYKQIEGRKRLFFCKPFVMAGAAYNQNKTTLDNIYYNPTTMVYTRYLSVRNESGVRPDGALGIAFGWRLGQWVVGLTPVYYTIGILSGAPSLTLTAGYTFRNQSDFDGKEKKE